MNAVVLTVKASYVASTKYPRQAIAEGINSKPVVVWKMKVNCKMQYIFLINHLPVLQTSQLRLHTFDIYIPVRTPINVK